MGGREISAASDCEETKKENGETEPVGASKSSASSPIHLGSISHPFAFDKLQGLAYDMLYKQPTSAPIKV